MDLDERAEEVLETLWIRTQEETAEAIPVEELEPGQRDAIEKLLDAGYVAVSDGRARLAGSGLALAQDVIRRHRLAERLLLDVLSTADTLLDDMACKFEHVLDRGIAESICSLLGHPKVCPHGKPIPPGDCCREGRRSQKRVVSPLAQMSTGEKGKIAYVHAPQATKLQKLMSMGVLPGAPVSLLQRFPSFVFQIRQEQFAVDKEIAESIYVRLVEAEALGQDQQTEREQRTPIWGRFRLLRGRRGRSRR